MKYSYIVFGVLNCILMTACFHRSYTSNVDITLTYDAKFSYAGVEYSDGNCIVDGIDYAIPKCNIIHIVINAVDRNKTVLVTADDKVIVHFP